LCKIEQQEVMEEDQAWEQQLQLALAMSAAAAATTMGQERSDDAEDEDEELKAALLLSEEEELARRATERAKRSSLSLDAQQATASGAWQPPPRSKLPSTPPPPNPSRSVGRPSNNVRLRGGSSPFAQPPTLASASSASAAPEGYRARHLRRPPTKPSAPVLPITTPMWSTDFVCRWLRSVELDSYVARFREHANSAFQRQQSSVEREEEEARPTGAGAREAVEGTYTLLAKHLQEEEDLMTAHVLANEEELPQTGVDLGAFGGGQGWLIGSGGGGGGDDDGGGGGDGLEMIQDQDVDLSYESMVDLPRVEVGVLDLDRLPVFTFKRSMDLKQSTA